jgi:hypothetical protein
MLRNRVDQVKSDIYALKSGILAMMTPSAGRAPIAVIEAEQSQFSVETEQNRCGGGTRKLSLRANRNATRLSADKFKQCEYHGIQTIKA